MAAILTFPVSQVSHRYSTNDQQNHPQSQEGGGSALLDFGRLAMAWSGSDGGDATGTLAVTYVHFPDDPSRPFGEGIDHEGDVVAGGLGITLHFEVDTTGIPDAAITANLGGLGGIGLLRVSSTISGEAAATCAVSGEGAFPGLVPGVNIVDADLLGVSGEFSTWGDTSVEITDVHIELEVHLILTDVTPPSSGTRGNDTVVLTGGPFDGSEAVTFDGVLALNVECPDPFTLIVVTPPHAVGIVDVVVTNATYGSAIYSFFNYYLMESPPTIVNPALLASGAVPINVVTEAFVTRGYNNGALSYWWRQVSGPEQVTIHDPDHVNTELTFERFVVGTYVFELAVTTEDDVFTVPSGMTIVLSTQPPRVASGRLHGT